MPWVGAVDGELTRFSTSALPGRRRQYADGRRHNQGGNRETGAWCEAAVEVVPVRHNA